MNFKAAVAIVIDIEGGDKVVNHPDDPGGLTKWGISLRAFPELGEEGIRNLSREGAERLYLARYWIPAFCEEMP